MYQIRLLDGTIIYSDQTREFFEELILNSCGDMARDAFRDWFDDLLEENECNMETVKMFERESDEYYQRILAAREKLNCAIDNIIESKKINRNHLIDDLERTLNALNNY